MKTKTKRTIIRGLTLIKTGILLIFKDIDNIPITVHLNNIPIKEAYTNFHNKLDLRLAIAKKAKCQDCITNSSDLTDDFEKMFSESEQNRKR